MVFKVGDRVRYTRHGHYCIPLNSIGRVVEVCDDRNLDVSFEGKRLKNARENNCWWADTIYFEKLTVDEEEFE